MSQCILAIVFSIANVLRIRHSGQAIQAGINIIIFGGMTVATIASAGQLFLDRVAWSEDYCRNNYHEGRQHECEDWAAKYVVISWIWLVLSLVLGYDDFSWTGCLGLSLTLCAESATQP